MGLLDDAIREHLDLKRRRGGDPAEIEKAEREALGPVRREPTIGSLPEELSARMDDQAPPPGTWEEAETHEPRPQRRGLLHRRSSQPKPAIERIPETPDPPGPVEEDVPIGFADDADVTRAPLDAGFAPAPEMPPRFEPPDRDVEVHPAASDFEIPAARTGPHEGTPAPEPDFGERPGETIEYDVEESFAEAERPADEDVLEETPEFLQDTPDHDRLWFEQRPPKDFDFEG